MKKKLICALMTAAMAGSLVSGLTVSADSDSQVTISLYTTLPNKDAQFEQLCEEFMEENPDIKVNYIAYDSSEKQKWMTLYASGDAPTISIMDPVDIQENIENMAALDSFILLENRLLEPCFVLWDRVNSEKFFSFGEEGNGPEDFLPTAMLVQSTEKTILEYGMVTQSENTNIKGIHLHLTPRNWIAPM